MTYDVNPQRWCQCHVLEQPKLYHHVRTILESDAQKLHDFQWASRQFLGSTL